MSFIYFKETAMSNDARVSLTSRYRFVAARFYKAAFETNGLFRVASP